MSAAILGADADYMLKILEFRKMFDSYNVEPVSYTHLDVYKRQLCSFQRRDMAVYFFHA